MDWEQTIENLTTRKSNTRESVQNFKFCGMETRNISPIKKESVICLPVSITKELQDKLSMYDFKVCP